MGIEKSKEKSKIKKLVLVELIYDDIKSYPQKLLVKQEFKLDERINIQTHELHFGYILENNYLRLETFDKEHFYILEKDNIWVHSHKGKYI